MDHPRRGELEEALRRTQFLMNNYKMAYERKCVHLRIVEAARAANEHENQRLKAENEELMMECMELQRAFQTQEVLIRQLQRENEELSLQLQHGAAAGGGMAPGSPGGGTAPGHPAGNGTAPGSPLGAFGGPGSPARSPFVPVSKRLRPRHQGNN